ncbi:MAG: 5'/3'-nucleotidase SurE [Bdellovibrionales bacterium]|nr:5'/3'-nucleotidase SurE [Bdellovibrionales bacterium]
MRTLISNDDGVHAPGIHALQQWFSKKRWHATIVAPERERSATGHSLTLHKPLRIHRYGARVFSVSGGPADCIYLGMREVLGKRPDLVLSGINRGANLGQDVFYSGTVSAAREAAIAGIPAVAVSLVLSGDRKGRAAEHWGTAAWAAEQVLERFLAGLAPGKGRAAALRKWPPGVLLNINVPNLPRGRIKGIRSGVQGRQIYSGEILRRKDARGRRYYWIGGSYQGFRDIKGSDCWLAHHGYVAVTPLDVDTTDVKVLGQLQQIFP